MNTIALVTVAAGGAGAVLRYLVSLWLARPRVEPGARFPWTVLVVNAVGSALGGAVLALADHGLSEQAQLVLLSGVCGGLTTFSTFSVETVQLVREGQAGRACVSVCANVLVGFAACALTFAAFGGSLG